MFQLSADSIVQQEQIKHLVEESHRYKYELTQPIEIFFQWELDSPRSPIRKDYIQDYGDYYPPASRYGSFGNTNYGSMNFD